ncbi:MAG TPA: single-stranded-DNA-specific exonuclease RecJ, partial [Burkholderiales bacterium]|nr:single-stranded-DNA-specific exonuclease RecJ [Burkholderiales bacterium]
ELPADLHPVLRRIYGTRQVRSALELDRSLERLASPDALKGMTQAVALLAQALRGRQRILVLADFDADGATSCALMLRALRALGAHDVDYLVPNRFEYGYGLTPEIVEVAVQRKPDLLVTVDNGISSVDGVRAAQAHGIRVLITDHHLPGTELPPADAIVNPNQTGCEFPSKALAGVGTAFYTMLALRAHLRASGWFAEQNIAEPNLAKLLDLVALGTVADVVPLDANNRILVSHGLNRMRAEQCVPGIRALVEVGGRQLARLGASDLGFVVGPRLNAAGRLTDMSLGIECLLTDDLDRARELARTLDQLNRERREIERGMNEQAVAAVAALQLESTLPRGLCLFDESWHQGLIGIVAARVRERTHRPVIAFAPGNGTEIKGSARSVAGLHVRDALDSIATRRPNLLHKFGGHAMAAGLTLEREHYQDFTAAFDEEVSRWLSDDDLCGTILSDGELGTDDFTLDLAQALRDGGPWGSGFPEPIFDGAFEVVERRIVGEKHLKLVLRSPQGGRTIEAIAFRAAGVPAANEPRIRAAYRLDVNEYQGRRSVQLVVEHLERVE